MPRGGTPFVPLRLTLHRKVMLQKSRSLLQCLLVPIYQIDQPTERLSGDGLHVPAF